LGADYVLVNPLHAAEPVAPMEPSPYLPTSRRFFNPLYLRVERIPEYADLAGPDRTRVRRLRTGLASRLKGVDAIDRNASWKAKRAALRVVHGVPRTAGREADYQAFRNRHGDGLVDFATWNVLAELHGNDYRSWPEELQDPGSDEVFAFRQAHEAEVDFHMWLQWVVDEQLQLAQAKAVGAGMALGVMHDLAVGIHPGGADAWRGKAAYARDVQVGAPPDAYNQIGQNWGQPPWRPDRLAELGYAPFRELIGNVLRHAGGVRVDHVIGLFRLWWVPPGQPPSEGTYVRYDHEAMVGILALEAHRAGALVVGEDLGVVEPSARKYLARRGILGTSILWFERDDQGRPLAAEAWRELCLASVTTHDLPPTAGYLASEHVRLRDELDLLTRPLEEEVAADAAERESWLDEVRGRGLLSEHADVEQTVTALHEYLTLTPARLLNVALVDAVGDRRTQNQPGTTDEYPNWRVPLSGADGVPMLLEDVLTSKRAAALAATVRQEG
ncbi:MAG TPA: 4-alpha-glucanotransferase, partial [Acidimicrobiales bacterium]|nr:4-alpha-glucanotransferase [Acidimicrobiales bacterium]